MDRNVLHRFFAGTASFEEEEAVCDWVDASDKNREELIRERKYFDVLLLHKTKNSSMVQSGHRFSLPFVIRESLKIAAAISVLLVSALYISNNVGKSAPVLEMNKIVVPPVRRPRLENTVRLLGIDSPSGYTENAAKYVQEQFAQMGYDAKITRKGGVLIDLGGEDTQDALLLEAHTDTLGGMVAEIKGDGRLRIVNVGGMNANNAEAENCRVVTKFSGSYEGTLQLINASVHVNGDYASTKRSWDTVEVVLDEAVESADDVKALGISVGDFVCFEPRTRVTKSGYIKSRFLDDKLSVGILLGLAKFMKDKDLTPRRRVYAHVTVYEEVGHGGAASVPQGVTEAISVDMGCVGDGLRCTERQVSICAKDSGGPYSYEVVGRLMDAARREKADYAVDVYPHYGSDVEATLSAGNDLRHGLIGAGVYASHGYERSHIDGVWNTLKVLKGYLEI